MLDTTRAMTAVIWVAWAVCGCGASAHPPNPVQISGTVERVCPGPLVAGHPRRCLQTAALSGGGRRVAVQGRFTVTLPPGRYRLTVDGCARRSPLTITRPVSGLRLSPIGCAFPE
jgi:hypothetical protein